MSNQIASDGYIYQSETTTRRITIQSTEGQVLGHVTAKIEPFSRRNDVLSAGQQAVIRWCNRNHRSLGSVVWCWDD